VYDIYFCPYLLDFFYSYNLYIESKYRSRSSVL